MQTQKKTSHIVRYEARWSQDYRQTFPNGNVISNQTNGGGFYNMSFTDERIGFSDPKFLQKIKRGESATTPLDAWRYEATYVPHNITMHLRGVGNNPRVDAIYKSTQGYMGFGWLDYSKPNFDFSTADNDAAIAIRKKIHSEQVSWSGGVFLGEIRETIRMLKSPAKAMRQYAQHFVSSYTRIKRQAQRLNGRKNARNTNLKEALANQWLEYSMGFAPFVMDIRDILETLDKQVENRTKRISAFRESATSSRVNHGLRSVLKSGTPFNYDAFVNIERRIVNKAYVRYTCGYEAKLLQDITSPIQKLYVYGGFNLRETASIIYELTPWSFLIDYFSNLGDVIQANFTSLENVKWVNKTVRLHHSEVILPSDLGLQLTPNTTLIDWQGSMGQLKLDSYRTIRSAASIPLGTISFELPGHSNQFLNIGALAIARIKN